MRTIRLTGAMFAKMVQNGAKNLQNKKQVVNELNVFPVPDGDTGDNMAMTLMSIENNQEIFDPAAIEVVAQLIAHEALLGARGNSGVILSRIFAGIAEGLKEKIEVGVPEFDYAMKCGIKEAYNAVSEPVEGTILTVLREGTEEAGAIIDDTTTFEEYFEVLAREMHNSVERTPELLPSLKDAGVVDSGGVGLFYVFEGMSKYLGGGTLDLVEDESNFDGKDLDISLFTEDSELEFGYCAELLIRLQNKKIKIADFDLDNFIEHLKTIGESVVAFRDDSIVKVHLHTLTPDKVLAYGQKFGEFLKIKIENMTLQHNGAVIRNDFEDTKRADEPIKFKNPRKKYGVVAVAAGEGLVQTFRELGCDAVLGQQNMNPATSDFLEAFENINAENILVFPNNKNVIMAAQQAAETYQKSKVIILETKTIGEGYVAVSMLDTSLKSVEEIVDNVNDAIATVMTGQISKSSRDVEMDGVKVIEGDYIGFANGTIYTDKEDREAAVIDLLKKLDAHKYDVIVVVFGKDVDSNAVAKLKKQLSDAYGHTEICFMDGGQPLYDYILILE